MNSPSEFLGGDPINSFQGAGLPTLRDVMRFYTQFWNMRGSETNRSRRVTNELLKFYSGRSIPTISERGIMNKVERFANDLKTILKYNSKRKRPRNTNSICEQRFTHELDAVFRIEVTDSNFEMDSVGISDPTQIDTDNTNGILYFPTI